MLGVPQLRHFIPQLLFRTTPPEHETETQTKESKRQGGRGRKLEKERDKEKTIILIFNSCVEISAVLVAVARSFSVINCYQRTQEQIDSSVRLMARRVSI